MLEIDVPGYKQLQLSELVLDYNGTLACGGHPLEGIKDLLNALSDKLHVHVLTADTFGKVKKELSDVKCRIIIIPHGDQDIRKLDFIKELGPEKTVCIGNGRNDRLMLKEAALGIAVIQKEAAAVETVMAADVVAPDISAALGLLSNPLRLVATLRS
jgi:soluble P-type ATPase